MTVPLDMLRDARLSLKAKGLLCLLLSADDDQGLPSLLREAVPDGKGSVDSALQELGESGYLNEVAGVLMVDSVSRKSGKSATLTARTAENQPILEAVTETTTSEKFDEKGQELAENPPFHEIEHRGGYIRGVNEEVTLKEKDVKEKSTSLFPEMEDGPCLMRNSLVNTFEKALAHFTEEEAAGIDIRHYFGSVMDWSETGGAKNKPVKRTSRGWIATMRTWMRNDNEKGKLRRVAGNGGPDLSNFFKH